jgi:hypothetical protein
MNISSRTMRVRAASAAAALVALGAVTVAQAADPGSGTVSPSNPKVSWKGTLQSSGIFYNAWDQDPTIDCAAPACDTFALKLEGAPKDLTLTLNIQNDAIQGNEGGGGIRVLKPDGNYQWVKGTSSKKTTLKLKLKNAAPGDYQVTSVASYVCCAQSEYIGGAEIPAATTAPAPAPATPPASGTQSSAPPEIKVTAPKASAKKLKKSRKLKVALSSNGPIKNLKGFLTKGKAKFATGSLASLNGNGTITLKLSSKAAKKLKAGTYGISVSGTDAEGRTVGTAIRVKIGR